MADEPPVRRRIIGAALRRYRQDLGYGLDDAAAVLDCDSSKMSRIETGHRGIRLKELRELLAEYGVPPAERQALIALAGPPGRWRDLHPAAGDIILIEAAAAELSVYGPQLIPDLLQVPGYAGAVSVAQDRPPQPGSDQLDDIAGTLAAHQQAVLEAGTQLSVVIGEAALHQEVGGPAVMTEQIARLIEVAGRHPQLTLQVIPFAAGAHAAIRGGAHTIMQLAPGIGAVYLPGITGGTVLDSQADLAMYTSAFARLRMSALSAQDTVRMLRVTTGDLPPSR